MAPDQRKRGIIRLENDRHIADIFRVLEHGAGRGIKQEPQNMEEVDEDYDRQTTSTSRFFRCRRQPSKTFHRAEVEVEYTLATFLKHVSFH